MNIYRMLGSRMGTPDALDLSERLSAWHDAMVAHERLRTRVCNDECPHADAGLLWREAMEAFGDRAGELRFLKSRASRADSHTLGPGLQV